MKGQSCPSDLPERVALPAAKGETMVGRNSKIIAAILVAVAEFLSGMGFGAAPDMDA